MKKYKIVNYDEFPNCKMMEEFLIEKCLNIANAAKFATDYNDVKEHIFGQEQYIKSFIVEEDISNIDIKGFLIADLFKGYNDNTILHCHGLIIHPDVQGMGFSKMLVNNLIKEYNPDVVTAKTHNPRIYNMFTTLDSIINYYPNLEGDIPEDIYQLVHSNPFIKLVNDNLIYENAYPDEKIQQSYRRSNIKEIFNKLNIRDAQAIVVVLNDDKLKLNNYQKIKK